MPRFDGTGPWGGIGKGLGPCGFQRGFGCGYRRISRKDESQMLKEYIEDLKEEIRETEEYLKDLEG